MGGAHPRGGQGSTDKDSPGVERPLAERPHCPVGSVQRVVGADSGTRCQRRPSVWGLDRLLPTLWRLGTSHVRGSKSAPRSPDGDEAARAALRRRRGKQGRAWWGARAAPGQARTKYGVGESHLRGGLAMASGC